MRRRDFIALVGSAAATWPLAARAQPAAMPAIGILSGGSSESFTPLEPAFRKGLAEAGFADGKIPPFEYRWAQGQFDRLPGLAVDLVGRGPAVIATVTLPAALAAKAATGAIPVVFVVGEDPVKVGLVTSLNRPSANVTGISNFMNLLGAKRLELVIEVVPKAEDLALLVNPKNPNAEADTADLRAAADALGRRLHVLTASSDAEIEAAFAAAVRYSVAALFVDIDPFLFDRREQLAIVAARHGVPTLP
ncbi:MAG: ABC transporter substrate-binding protein, partial [Xanthobacteraceae bacterium]